MFHKHSLFIYANVYVPVGCFQLNSLNYTKFRLNSKLQRGKTRKIFKNNQKKMPALVWQSQQNCNCMQLITSSCSSKKAKEQNTCKIFKANKMPFTCSSKFLSAQSASFRFLLCFALFVNQNLWMIRVGPCVVKKI